MPHAVEISDSEFEVLRRAAESSGRSLAAQAAHWLRLGRVVEHDPRLGELRVEQALHGPLSVDDLSGDEQEEFMDRFADQLRAPSEAADAFHAERELRGLGVGMDDAGNLVVPPNAER